MQNIIFRILRGLSGHHQHCGGAHRAGKPAQGVRRDAGQHERRDGETQEQREQAQQPGDDFIKLLMEEFSISTKLRSTKISLN